MPLRRLRPVALALLATLALAAACTPSRPRLGDLPGAERDSIRVNPTRGTSSARGLVDKRVRAKRPITTLVAADDSWCVVGEEEFARIRIGDNVRCAWSAGAAP
jgi:hypothetical protein